MTRMDVLREPPVSIEAEQAVLGGLMLSPEALMKVSDWLTEDDFFRTDHRIIYRAIVQLHAKDKPYDAVTLGEWFQAQGLVDTVGASYVIELANSTPSAANIVAYAEIVIEKATLRRLIDAGTEIAGAGFNPNGAAASLIAAKAQLKLSTLVRSRAGVGPQSIKTRIGNWMGELQRKYDGGQEITGLPTPWAKVNKIGKGLHPGDVIVIAGRPNMGKSVLAFNIAEHLGIVQHKRVLIFSMEMTTDQYLGRTTSSISEVPHDFIYSPNKEDERESYWPKIFAATARITSSQIQIDDEHGLTIEQLVARAKRAHLQAPIDLIVADHIHCMSIPGRNEASERGLITKGLKGLAKFCNCPVIALAQLNRGLMDRPDKRPNMSDIRAAGGIEEDADEIWFVHREDYYNKDTHLVDVVEMILGKGRNVKTGQVAHLMNRFDIMRADNWEGPLPTPKQKEKPAENAGGAETFSDRARRKRRSASA